MTILGVDLSHWQGSPNFAQVKASGRDFVVLKATEGTSYVDLTCNGGYDAIRKVQVPSNRANAHAAGLIVGLYHFARAGNPAAEALYFLRTIGTLQPGEFLVLDQEVPNTVAWCQAWLDAVYQATGVRPLIYMNQSATTGLKLGNWSGVAANYGLWLAVYDQSTAQPSVPYWGAPAMKQFYDQGVVPGIAGPCDVDVFYGTRDQLLAYGKSGAPPQEDDMTPDQAQQLAEVHDMLRGGMTAPENNFHWLWEALSPAIWEAPTPARGGPWPIDRLVGIDNKTGQIADAVAKVQAPVVDPVALANALLADDAVVAKLGKAIADNLQLSPRADS